MDRHLLARKVDNLLEVGWSGMLPVSLDDLCRTLRVHVAEHDDPRAPMGRLVVEGGIALILVATLPPAQSRLHIAFLLALYLNGVTWYDLRPEFFQIERLQSDPIARLAYCAAAHMLIPRFALEQLLRESPASLSSLASRLQVGTPLLDHRLHETGLSGRLEPAMRLVSCRPLRPSSARAGGIFRWPVPA